MAKIKLTRIAARAASHLRKRRTLRALLWQISDLPYDVILEVFLHLDYSDVLSLAQVCRLFYEASQSVVIWQNLAFKLMCRGRRISLHDHLSLSYLSPTQIKQSVRLSTAVEASWLTAQPKHVARPPPVRLHDVDLDHASYIMKFTSNRHFVLPTKAGDLVGWDSTTGSCAGKLKMGVGSALINVQADYATRSLYWLIGKRTSASELEQNLQIKILRVQFPEPLSSNPVSFTVLREMVAPAPIPVELHFLDCTQRMLCTVFVTEGSWTAGLHVVLDWDTGLSYILDTGVIYEYGRAVIGLHLSADKKFLILRSEQYGMEVMHTYSIAKMQAGASIWSAALGSPLLSLSGIPVASTSAAAAASAGVAYSRWHHEDPAFDTRFMPHTVWVLPQWWPTYPGVPRRTSTIVLYSLRVDDEEAERGWKYVWRAAQHYSDAVETVWENTDLNESKGEGDAHGFQDWKVIGGASCAPVRSVINIGADAVTIRMGNHHELPIIAQSFNHIAWIEETVENDIDTVMDIDLEEGIAPAVGDRNNNFHGLRHSSLFGSVQQPSGSERSSSVESVSTASTVPRRVRRLKLVTFPDPGSLPIQADCKHIRRKKRGGLATRLARRFSRSSTANKNSVVSLKCKCGSKLRKYDPNSGSGSDSDSEYETPYNLHLKCTCECTCTMLRPATLDVPTAVLERAYHMVLDAAVGTVTLATEENELVVFRYGKGMVDIGCGRDENECELD